MTLYVLSQPYLNPLRAACGYAGNTRPLELNVREDAEAFTIQALAPALSPENIQIQIINDIITIQGRFPESEGNYLWQELPGGEFRRTVRLPAKVDAERAEAHLEAGILTVRLPKSDSARPKVIPLTPQ